jgi:hypothetical protein
MLDMLIQGHQRGPLHEPVAALGSLAAAAHLNKNINNLLSELLAASQTA